MCEKITKRRCFTADEAMALRCVVKFSNFLQESSREIKIVNGDDSYTNNYPLHTYGKTQVNN